MPTIRCLTLLGASVLAAASCTRAPVAERPASSASADRVARIEAALLPNVIIEGRELETPNLEERMSHYGVPGVSVAKLGPSRHDILTRSIRVTGRRPSAGQGSRRGTHRVASHRGSPAW